MMARASRAGRKQRRRGEPRLVAMASLSSLSSAGSAGSDSIAIRLAPTTRRGTLQRIASVADRLLAMDSGAFVRLRPLPGGLDLFFSTPLGCVVTQRLPNAVVFDEVPGEETPLEEDTAVVMASQLKAGLTAALASGDHTESTIGEKGTVVHAGARSDLLWRGALPPLSGYHLVDWVPAGVVRDAHREMGEEQEVSGGPAGIAWSLLEQDVIEVSADDDSSLVVNLTGRMIAALGAAGVVNEPSAQLRARAERLAADNGNPKRDVDVVRVSAVGSWIRVDGLFGTLYAPRPGGLARVP